MLSMIINSSQNYSSSRRSPFSCMLSTMQYSSKLSMRWEMPSSSPNYSSNNRQRFSCTLNNSKYSNKLGMMSLSPSSSHLCTVYKWQNCYKFNTALILLNKQCKLWLKSDSTQNYSSNKRLRFSCMLSIMKCSSKLNMRSLWPDSSHCCKKCMLKHYYNSHITLI
jgi:hypothetical protein